MRAVISISQIQCDMISMKGSENYRTNECSQTFRRLWEGEKISHFEILKCLEYSQTITLEANS